MKYDLIIKGGTICNASGTFVADLGIKGGTIVALQQSLPDHESIEIIEAKGKYILPGGIDVHVHLELPFCGTVSADDFASGTRAAAAGGITTVIDYGMQDPKRGLMDGIKQRRDAADPKVGIDYSLHGIITDWDRLKKNDLEKAIEAGISSFKMFMIYKSEGWQSDDGELLQALETSRDNGMLVMVHAESNAALDSLVRRYHPQRKKLGAWGHVVTRPNYIEEEAIQRAIFWAEQSGGKLYIVHTSTAEGTDQIALARAQGIQVQAETCPQYLLLDDQVFRGPNGHYYATCPQIKKRADSRRLWDGLASNEIQVVATDTCTFTTKQKDRWRGDFTKIPFGLPGSELMLPLMHTYGVGKKKISLERMVELTCANPARIFGLYPRKGVIQIGSDADLVIWDRKRQLTVDYRKLETNCDWSPFQDFKLRGYPELTLCRGHKVAEKGRFIGEAGWGEFIPRQIGESS